MRWSVLFLGMSDDQLTKIQEIITHQEQQIQDLSDVVMRQADDLDFLKKKMVRMGEKMQVMEEEARASAQGGEGLSVTEQAALNKPPHY